MNLINDIVDIKWNDKKAPLTDADLWLIKKQIPFTLPKKFIDLLKISDGGYVSYEFDYFDYWYRKNMPTGISIIYGAKEDGYYDLLYNYYNPPEGFAKNLVAFAGDSDRICFDYRQDLTTDNPPIVYWQFEAPEEESISPLADDFMGFLRILREPEPLENYLKKSEEDNRNNG